MPIKVNINKDDHIEPKFLEEDKEKAELQYQAVLVYCKTYNQSFVDGEFPHVFRKQNTDRWSMTLAKIPLVTWPKRHTFTRPVLNTICTPIAYDTATNTYLVTKPSKWTIYDNPQASEVCQRGIGDCGLIAAMLHLPFHPRLLDAIFHSRSEICEHGVYQVRLCVFGEWKTILVDDWFPSRDKSTSISSSDRNQLWVSLIEKAVAKVAGSYEKLEGFDCCFALSLLTGSSCRSFFKEVIWKDDPDILWKMLITAYNSGFLMTIGTKFKTDKEFQNEKQGISYGHAYAVLEVIEIDSHRLTRLRNPGMGSTWTGKWSLFGNDQPSEVSTNLFFIRSFDPYSFWIDIDDLFKHIHRLFICRYRPSWCSTRINMVVGGSLTDRHMMIRLVSREKCVVSIDAFRKSYKMRGYFWITIHQLGENGSVGELVVCTLVEHSSNDILLEPGVYSLSLSHWYRGRIDMNVVVHSSEPITAELIPLNPFLLQKAYHQMFREKGIDIEVKRNDMRLIKYQEGEYFMLIMAENWSKEKYLHVHIDCTKKALRQRSFSRFIKSSEAQIYGDVIPPMSRQVLLGCHFIVEADPPGFPIHIEYFMSEESETKISFAKKKGAHIPAIPFCEYHHLTTPIIVVDDN